MTAPESALRQTVVVVPAHNEIAHLPQCLRALTTAALGTPSPVTIVVVLDSCDDGSDRLAARYGTDVHFVSVDAGNAFLRKLCIKAGSLIEAMPPTFISRL